MTSAPAPHENTENVAFRTIDAFTADIPLGALVAVVRDGTSFRNRNAILNPSNNLLGGQALAHCLTASCVAKAGAEPASAHILFVARPDPWHSYLVDASVLRSGQRMAQLSVSVGQRGQCVAQASVLMRMAMPPPPAGIVAFAGRLEDFGSPEDAIPREESGGSLVETASPLEFAVLKAYPCFEIRLPRQASVVRQGVKRSAYWLRLPGSKGLPVADHYGLFALASDFWFTLPMILEVPDRPLALKDLSGTSLDHAIWFHSRPNCAQWLLFQTEVKVLHGSSVLVEAIVSDEARQPIATVLQELYLHARRNAPRKPLPAP